MRLGTIMIVAMLGTLPLAARADKDTKDSASLFRQKCSSCHGKDGKATGFIARHEHATDLTSPAVQQQSDAALAEVIKNGKGKMPAYGNKLSEQEIGGLAAYIHTLGGK